MQTRAQKDALRELKQASQEILDLTTAVASNMERIHDSVENGQHTPSLNHQYPFDLATAIQRRVSAIRYCSVLDCETADIVEASRGGR